MGFEQDIEEGSEEQIADIHKSLIEEQNEFIKTSKMRQISLEEVVEVDDSNSELSQTQRKKSLAPHSNS